jgi:hypothetical protein
MIAPLAKLIDWSAIQVSTMQMPNFVAIPKACGIIASAHHSDHVKPFRIRALFCLSSVGRWFQKLY